jgi:hypothetical protein
MKLYDLIRHLEGLGRVLAHEGHIRTIFENPVNSRRCEEVYRAGKSSPKIMAGDEMTGPT